MTYEEEFEFRLREDGRRVMDASKAKALRCVMESGSLDQAAKRLKTTPERLWSRLHKMKDGRGTPLVVRKDTEISLTPGGLRLLEAFESREQFLNEQLRRRYRNPVLTVDGIVQLGNELVLVQRGRDPFLGMLALPGGIVEYGETVEQAVVREVREETGLETRVVRLLSVYSEPDRDPRGHFITAAFLLEVTGGELRSGDDAQAVVTIDPQNLTELAFDHSRIVTDFLKRRG